MSSMVGVTCRSLNIALFACLISIQIRISLGSDDLGTTTIEETHGVGPVTSSIIPLSSSFPNLFRTGSLKLKAIRL